MKPELNISKGSLLVSEPFMSDDFFKRSVVLLAESTEKGSFGFVLNKPTDINIDDAISDFPPFNSKLFFGGPSDSDTIFYIHTIGHKLEGSKEIKDGIYWSGDFEQLKFMINTGQVTKNMIRFYVGYSGWESKDLKYEIKQKAWITSIVNKKFAFHEKPENLWNNVLKSMGKEYSILTNCPEDPQWN